MALDSTMVKKQLRLSLEKDQVKSSPVIRIQKGDDILAIILRQEFEQEGIHFLTPDEFSQQLAYMKHPTGKTIMPHVHNGSIPNIH
jgi:hypothetical protein